MHTDLLHILEERGFIHQCTDREGLLSLLKKQVTAYIGFDCTAPALHAGSLIQIMILRWLEKSGHKPIILLGGGTTKIGDPSGRDETRKLLDMQGIQENIKGIRKIFERFLPQDKKGITVVNNDEWLSSLNYIDFLRDIGRHFSVNKMLSFDSVKLRLEREQNLSFLEFNYMILQAYDFVELYKHYGCRLQIGGSDQWGNIVNGVELGRRLGTEELFGLTTPLITTATGAKMGKTAAGAVWLTEDLCSAYDYWQFWRNTEDKDVGRFLRLFTDLPLAELQKLEKLKDAEINEAKIVLANEATSLCHGKEKAMEAHKTAQKTFEQGGFGDSLPVIELSKEELNQGIPLYKLLHQAGLAGSGGEARRLIEGGGAKVNDNKAPDPMQLVGIADINAEGVIKLSAGKKKHALVKELGK